jgi:hypothetical protein
MKQRDSDLLKDIDTDFEDNEPGPSISKRKIETNVGATTRSTRSKADTNLESMNGRKRVKLDEADDGPSGSVALRIPVAGELRRSTRIRKERKL